MNGAGAGGRLVANRRGTASATQLGSRRQRYSDLRTSFGLSASYEQSRTSESIYRPHSGKIE